MDGGRYDAEEVVQINGTVFSGVTNNGRVQVQYSPLASTDHPFARSLGPVMQSAVSRCRQRCRTHTRNVPEAAFKYYNMYEKSLLLWLFFVH